MRKLALVSFATGGTVTTQTPFQISRLPNSSNYTNNCPVNNDTIRTYSAVCGNGTLWGIVPQQNAASTPSNAVSVRESPGPAKARSGRSGLEFISAGRVPTCGAVALRCG
jgi:hypothetical protein